MSHSIPDALRTAAAKCDCDRDQLLRFSQYLHELEPYQAARINPFAFASAAGLNAETTLDLFVHGAKVGLFDLEWGMVCPLCGAITNSVSELDRVAAEVVHCSLCQRDVDSTLDDTIEVTFAYAPNGSALDIHRDFVTYQHYFTSSSYPYRVDWLNYHLRHTVADVKLRAGQTSTLLLSLEAGQTYRVICFDTHSGANLQVAADSEHSSEPQTVMLTLSPAGFSPPQTKLESKNPQLTLANLTDASVWCRVLRIDMQDVTAIIERGVPEFDQRLTGKHLLNNQAFRENFALNYLAPDLKLKLRSLTLLFTDLKGSTALYDREGDLAAYRLVQDHFVALKEVVREHSGAVIKTMGDAIMAAFSNGTDGTTAAIAMMEAMKYLPNRRFEGDVGLKVGLHAGPALAINAGTNLDYFGQTVNIAARVQGLADAGDICLTKAMNSEFGVTDALAQAGYSGRVEVAKLKGVAEAEQIIRYRSAA
ncbi:MAG: DUF5939 domain-containing protein [Hyphomicrobiaceae bacterium]